MEKKVLKVFVVLIIFSVSLINTVYHSNSDERLNIVNLADISVMARADGEDPGGNCNSSSYCDTGWNTMYYETYVLCCARYDPTSTGKKSI